MTAASVATRRDLDGLGDLPEGVVMFVADEGRHYERDAAGEWLQLVWMVSSCGDEALFATPVLANRVRDEVGGTVHRMLVRTRVGQ